MKRYITIISIVLLQFSIMFAIPSSAIENSDCTVRLCTENAVFSPTFESEVEVSFLNKELYNEKVFMSYHIYDKNNNELLWEGLRLPIVMDKDKGKVKFYINLSKDVDLKKYKYLKVKFDMVDESNLYWFSKNKSIKFNTCEIVYQNNFISKFKYIYSKALKEQTITFVVNMLVFVFAIYFAFRIKKNYNC